MRIKYLLWSQILFVLFILCVNPSVAQDNPLSNSSDNPIEISAQESFEWLQNQKQYKAVGAVIVTQGDLSLQADELIADYDESAQENLNITLITATGNVVLKDLDNTAYGDKIIYDLTTDDIVLTGQNIRLIAPEQNITARDSMTYNNKKGIAKAVGNARIKTAKETLNANIITANFSKNNQEKKQTLTNAIATGGVKITTKEEEITGNNGTYNAIKNTADIKGNVKITRGPNTLEGSRASVNLTTNISQIFGDKKSGKRVKGVFFPKSQNDN